MGLPLDLFIAFRNFCLHNVVPSVIPCQENVVDVTVFEIAALI